MENKVLTIDAETFKERVVVTVVNMNYKKEEPMLRRIGKTDLGYHISLMTTDIRYAGIQVGVTKAMLDANTYKKAVENTSEISRPIIRNLMKDIIAVSDRVDNGITTVFLPKTRNMMKEILKSTECYLSFASNKIAVACKTNIAAETILPAPDANRNYTRTVYKYDLITGEIKIAATMGA